MSVKRSIAASPTRRAGAGRARNRGGSAAAARLSWTRAARADRRSGRGAANARAARTRLAFAALRRDASTPTFPVLEPAAPRPRDRACRRDSIDLVLRRTWQRGASEEAARGRFTARAETGALSMLPVALRGVHGERRRRALSRGDRATRAHAGPARARACAPAVRRVAAPRAPDAREQLRAAHEMFSRAGAEAFAERARREVFTKLGVSSRKELRSTLAGGPPAAPSPAGPA